MGRPRDLWAWKQVEPIGNNKWKCNHCKDDFSGAASRIRDHLSGQGNGIAACPAATELIRNEALNKVSQNKRVRREDPSPSLSSNETNGGKIIEKRGSEKDVMDAFVKFLYCNNVSSIANDVVKDPFYMEFVERVSKHGFPESLFWDDSRFIKKTVSNIEDEVNTYIDHLKKSWNRTGCTMMMFNLHSNKNNGQLLATLEKDMIVSAFYCPNGIFFVDRDDEKNHYQAIMQNEGVNEMVHECCIGSSCMAREAREEHYQEMLCTNGDRHLCELTDSTSIYKQDRTFSLISCMQNKIEARCIRHCQESTWATNLIDIAVKIHENLCDCYQTWYYEILRREGLSFKLLVNNHPLQARRRSIFLSIQSIKYELRRPHPEPYGKTISLKVEEIIGEVEFWSEGKELARILKYVMKIGDVIDTFVPMVGYYAMILDEVDQIIRAGLEKDDSIKFWKNLQSDVEFFSLLDDYLNPMYYLQQLQINPKLWESLNDTIRKGVGEEVDRYANIFRNVPKDYKLEDHHPIKVWEEHGNELPKLQSMAFRALSQPLSCMCKQVKKHLYQLEGAEDYILRLNVRMMHHFKLLGDDDIYKPLDLSLLHKKRHH